MPCILVNLRTLTARPVAMFHAQEKGDLKVIGTVTASHVARCRSCKAALGVEPNESSSWREAMEAEFPNRNE